MTSVHTLASGSSGNALVISMAGAYFLVDAGISCRKIRQRLQALGIPRLDGLFLTHAHVDHISGLRTLLKTLPLPVYATAETLDCLPRMDSLCGFHPIAPEIPLTAAGVSITAFPTSHDAAGSCGYRFDGPDGAVGVLTDSGCVTAAAASVLPGVQLAVLEANHDVETLMSGPYPYYLKRRILGERGHLSNEDAAHFAVILAENGAEDLILAHLSRENNTPAMALHAVEAALSAAGLSPALSVAPRDEPGQAHILGRPLCRESH